MRRRSKFGNKGAGRDVLCKNGKIRKEFASQKESKRADELRLLEKLGEIADLEFQVRYELIPKNSDEKACHYLADFRYRANGQTIVEDVKGCKTDVYRLKRKLMRHVHNIKVLET